MVATVSWIGTKTCTALSSNKMLLKKTQNWARQCKHIMDCIHAIQHVYPFLQQWGIPMVERLM